VAALASTAAVAVFVIIRVAGGPIDILFPAGVETQPYGLFAEELRAASRNSTAESERDAGGRNAEEFRIHLPGEGVSTEQADVLVRSALRDTPTQADDGKRIVAVDPYVLVRDQRAGESVPAGPAETFAELATWLEGLDQDRWIPLLVSGNSPEDFAAFILYVAEAVLPPAEFAELTGSPDGAGASTEQRLDLAAPVVRLLDDWKDAGLLVFNWTNWDRLALRTAQRDARAAVSFQRRSLLKTLSGSESFHLEMVLPPVAASRRGYTMSGAAVIAAAAAGTSAAGTSTAASSRPQAADAVAAVRRILLDDPVQRAVETDTPFSPVRLAAAAVNREHRDVVRWFQGSRSYRPITPELAAEPLFKRLRQLLR